MKQGVQHTTEVSFAMSKSDRVYSCSWCEWKGSWDELEPLGSMTEESYEDVIGAPWEDDHSMSECPECGEPTPVKVSENES